jgi:CRISPR/Cas system CSM-associated protein Csm3 (group 7 of RAMP superfamily)
VGKNNHAYEGLAKSLDPFAEAFLDQGMPKRDRVRINHRGVADSAEGGKFDQILVLRGTRFRFLLEMPNTTENEWEKRIGLLTSADFKIGRGRSNGLGVFKVVSFYERLFDFENNESDVDAWATWKSSLNVLPPNATHRALKENIQTEQIRYTLELHPEDYFLFGDQDDTPKREYTVAWNENDPSYSEVYVVPGSSLKGVLAHRTLFHYNRLKGQFAATAEDVLRYAARDIALENLFGTAKSKEMDAGLAGNLWISDCFIPVNDAVEITFPHVAIDPHSGGAVDGAFFKETVLHLQQDKKFPTIVLSIRRLFHNQDETALKALECALQDVCNGLLALGGKNSKGYGFFSGEFSTSNKPVI